MQSQGSASAPKVFIVCSGLGHVKRGFESFTQECFDALSKDPALDLTLFKGGGEPNPKEISLWNFPRERWMAARLGELMKRGPYFVEQLSFFISILPYLHLNQPEVIVFSDINLGNALWRWRRLTKQPYKLLFSNGGPIAPPFDRWDHIHQVAPSHLRDAIEAGTPAEKQSLIPYGIHVTPGLEALAPQDRDALRQRLRMPRDRPVILSVGAINRYHKRMDYVVREIGRLPEPRPYLLLLGQHEAESNEIIRRGKEILGNEHFQAKTVEQSEISDYYKSADIFVLASLNEGFGRSFLEALSHGMPCLAHDNEITRFVLDEHGYFGDFSRPGGMSGLIRQALTENNDSLSSHRHRYVFERFSWSRLQSSYVQMIQQCAMLNSERTQI